MRLLSNLSKILTVFGIACGSAHAQTAITTNNFSIPGSGSYVMTGNHSNLTIAVNDVTVDLNGFVLWGSVGGVPGCPATAGSPGNSCSSTPSGSPALSITGNNVKIKNGFIAHGGGNGVAITAVSAVQNVSLEDVIVENFWGACILANNDGLHLKNVTVSQCGQYGLLSFSGVSAQNVTASYNNSDGINISGAAVLRDIQSNWNKGAGVVATFATADHVLSTKNLGAGQAIYGVNTNSLSSLNGGTGIITVGSGVVTNSSAVANSTADFNLDVATCYWGLSETTGGGVSGGTPLVGSTASCP